MKIEMTKCSDGVAEGHWDVDCESEQHAVVERIMEINGVLEVSLYSEDGLAAGDNTRRGSWVAWTK